MWPSHAKISTIFAYLYQEKTEGWLVRVKYEQGMPSYVIIGSGCIRLLLTDLCVFIFETIVGTNWV